MAFRWAWALAVVGLVGCSGKADGGGGGPRPVGVPDVMRGPSTDDDIDGDGVSNARDNCPSVANRDQRTACTYPSPPMTGSSVASDAVAQLNWVRALSGLGPVTEDPTLSRGCELHVDYLRQLSQELGGPVLSHEEDPSKPYATEEGNTAGVNSVLSYGESNIAQAINGWILTLYHRLPLLHPGLERIGVAYGERFACVRYREGTNTAKGAEFPILFPPADHPASPIEFQGFESPCPTTEDPFSPMCPGSATIVTVGVNGARSIRDVAGTLTNRTTGEEVPLFQTLYDGGPSMIERAGYLEGTIALVPEPNTQLELAPYEVNITATVDGTPETFRWWFDTSGSL